MNWKGKVGINDPTKRKRTSIWFGFYSVIIWSTGLLCSKCTLANSYLHCPANVFNGHGHFRLLFHQQKDQHSLKRKD